MNQPAPIPLTSIQAVAPHEVDPQRRSRLLANHLLFEVFLTVAEEPITLDARTFPYRILDGRIRIHEARGRGLIHVPAVLTVPRMTEMDVRISMLNAPIMDDDEEEEENAGTAPEPDGMDEADGTDEAAADPGESSAAED